MSSETLKTTFNMPRPCDANRILQEGYPMSTDFIITHNSSKPPHLKESMARMMGHWVSLNGAGDTLSVMSTGKHRAGGGCHFLSNRHREITRATLAGQTNPTRLQFHHLHLDARRVYKLRDVLMVLRPGEQSRSRASIPTVLRNTRPISSCRRDEPPATKPNFAS